MGFVQVLNRVFSRDVTAAMLVFLNNSTAAMSGPTLRAILQTDISLLIQITRRAIYFKLLSTLKKLGAP